MIGIPLNKNSISAYNKEDYASAEEGFKKLSKEGNLLSASNATPWYYLAMISLKKGDGKAAFKYLQESIRNQGRISGMKEKHDALVVDLKEKFPDIMTDGNKDFDKLIRP